MKYEIHRAKPGEFKDTPILDLTEKLNEDVNAALKRYMALLMLTDTKTRDIASGALTILCHHVVHVERVFSLPLVGDDFMNDVRSYNREHR